MLDFLSQIDPTVQVALIGAVSTIVVSVWALIRAWIKPMDTPHEEVYGPKHTTIVFGEHDQQRIDRAIVVIDSLIDTVERLRVEISLMKHR